MTQFVGPKTYFRYYFTLTAQLLPLGKAIFDIIVSTLTCVKLSMLLTKAGVAIMSRTISGIRVAGSGIDAVPDWGLKNL